MKTTVLACAQRMPTFFGGKVNTKIKGPLPAEWWEERKEKLEELGYTVTLGSQYNESWTSIEW